LRLNVALACSIVRFLTGPQLLDRGVPDHSLFGLSVERRPLSHETASCDKLIKGSFDLTDKKRREKFVSVIRGLGPEDAIDGMD
jgi:hypothetical protein